MERDRTINLTVIHEDGSPMTTQIWGCFKDARNYFNDYVRDDRPEGFAGHKLVIAAYVFDTMTKELRKFEVKDGAIIERY
jgi:hypothetical protein